MRRCSVCNLNFTEGFVHNAGESYYCSETCLHTVFTQEEWKEAYDDGDSESYYTEYEDNEFIDDDGQMIYDALAADLPKWTLLHYKQYPHPDDKHLFGVMAYNSSTGEFCSWIFNSGSKGFNIGRYGSEEYTMSEYKGRVGI